MNCTIIIKENYFEVTQAGSVLPVEEVKEAMKIKTKKAFLDSNLKAFDLGFSAAGAA